MWDTITANFYANRRGGAGWWPYVGRFQPVFGRYKKRVTARFWPQDETRRLTPKLCASEDRFRDEIAKYMSIWTACDLKDVPVEEVFLFPFDLPVVAHIDASSGRRWMATTKANIDRERNTFHAPLDRRDAHRRFAEWFKFECAACNANALDPHEHDALLSGPRLWSLYCHANGASWSEAAHMSHEALYAWAQKAFADGDLLAYEVVPTLESFTGGDTGVVTHGVHTRESYAKIAEPYARRHDIDLGTVKNDVKEITPAGSPHKVFEGSGETDALPNEVSEKCPSDNHRSESVDTASEDVKKWFGDEETLKEYGNRTLGRDGGGGFLAGTTRVVKIPAGTVLRRYCTTKFEYGSWQFYDALEGDPRVFAALPAPDPKRYDPGSPGTDMVKCQLSEDTEALVGLGAPRCSNKPGGPIQICLNYAFAKDSNKTKLL